MLTAVFAAGCYEALRRHSDKVTLDHLFLAVLKQEGGHAAYILKKLLRDWEIEQIRIRIEREQPQVFFVSCSSLLSVLAVLLRQMNIVPGKDVSVICFDNVERISENMGIPISYVKMPFLEMMERAVTYIKAAQSADPAVPKELLDAQLVVNGCPYLF